jgi:hypothetical protein
MESAYARERSVEANLNCTSDRAIALEAASTSASREVQKWTISLKRRSMEVTSCNAHARQRSSEEEARVEAALPGDSKEEGVVADETDAVEDEERDGNGEREGDVGESMGGGRRADERRDDDDEG